MSERLSSSLSKKFTAWLAIYPELNHELKIARMASNRYDIGSVQALVELMATNPHSGSKENVEAVITLLTENEADRPADVKHPTFLNPVLLDDMTKLEQVLPKVFSIASMPKCCLENYNGEALKRATLYNDLIDNPDMEYDESFVEKYSADIRRFDEFKAGNIPWYIKEFGRKREVWLDEDEAAKKADDRALKQARGSKRVELLDAAVAICNGSLSKADAIERLSKRRCVEWTNDQFPAWLQNELTDEQKASIKQVLGV